MQEKKKRNDATRQILDQKTIYRRFFVRVHSKIQLLVYYLEEITQPLHTLLLWAYFFRI